MAASKSKPQLPITQLGLHGGKRLIGRLHFPRQCLATRHERSDVLAAPLGLADGLGVAVAFGPQPVTLELAAAALVLESIERLDVQPKPAARQVARHLLGGVAE